MCAQVLEYEGLEKANAITIGDTTATIFFQEHDFITGPHIIVVRADWLNVYTATFIISLLNMEKYRYPVFGRAFTKDLIKLLISEYQAYVTQIELIPRKVELVDGLNYVFVGLRHAGKSYLMFQRVAQLIEQGHKKEEILKEVVLHVR